ncbi:hypothetical protein [Fodinibius salsisoli]|uniref:Uncharacterized protein n=1 Tax=Fodinibius salsisoli TaxID=2820877 RepID=A0ABT3PPQ5_9BACT|nr:hypothetical protein [Fodinibius salsisoli]MCW9707838.1 hypothetical protein [Fodinibius salsisoli]
MKSFAQKLIALSFIIALATGCASSVTDAGLSPEADTPQTEQVTPDQPDNPFGTEQDVQPIVDKPE